MISELRTGSALALQRYRVTRTRLLSAPLAGLLLAAWTLAGMAWIAARYPEWLAAEAGTGAILRPSLYAFALGCLLLPLQAQNGASSRWDGIRAWIVLAVIFAIGLIGAGGLSAGNLSAGGTSAYGLAVGALLLSGALPASIWLSGRR